MQFQTVHEMFIGMNSSSFSGDSKKKIAAVEKAIWNAYIQVCKLFNCNNLIMMILGYLSFMLLFIVAFAVDFFCFICYFFTICCYFTCYLQLFYSLVAIIFQYCFLLFLLFITICCSVYYYCQSSPLLSFLLFSFPLLSCNRTWLQC